MTAPLPEIVLLAQGFGMYAHRNQRRKDADYIVVTCPECLRSTSLPDSDTTGELQETECIACGATIRYLVDSSILKLLDDKRKRLPAM
jgi:hypothetical protein